MALYWIPQCFMQEKEPPDITYAQMHDLRRKFKYLQLGFSIYIYIYIYNLNGLIGAST